MADDRRPSAETVLLVEDELDVRTLAREMLESLGYAVLEAATPADALEIFERHQERIDVLLTDVVMPQMSGPRLARQLVAARPGLPVLYISGYTDTPTLDAGTPEPGTPFLHKPFGFEALARTIRDVLDRPR